MRRESAGYIERADNVPDSKGPVAKRGEEKMKRIVLLTAFMMIVSAALAQQPPKITQEQAAKFFRAMAQSQTAQSALQQTPQFKVAQDKQQAFQDAINELVKQCGEKFSLQLIKDGKPDNDGDPTCVVKPEPPKPAETPKKAPETPKK